MTKVILIILGLTTPQVTVDGRPADTAVAIPFPRMVDCVRAKVEVDKRLPAFCLGQVFNPFDKRG